LALVCIWAALNEKISVDRALGIVLGVGLCVFLVEITLLIGFMGDDAAEVVSGIFALNVGHITAQFGTLMLFRAWGYRLTRRKAEPPDPELVRFADE
jgi:hypothetical protein